MQITSKRQVTIPQHVRTALGSLPHMEVQVEVAGDHAAMRKLDPADARSTRAKRALDLLRGSAGPGMTTDEIMALTRGQGD